jgi:hypothetical protein
MHSRMVLIEFEKVARTYALFRLNKKVLLRNDDVFHRFIQIDSW